MTRSCIRSSLVPFVMKMYYTARSLVLKVTLVHNVLLICLLRLSVVVSGQDKPSFTEDPIDSLNIITKAAILKCKTVNALNAWFECSEDERFIDKKQTGYNYVDPRTGVRHIELQLEVKRRSNFNRLDVQCWCMAYGGHQTVTSRKASLHFASES